MKIICDCGNEDYFNTIDSDTGEETRITENEGQYSTVKNFTFWETHDVVGVVCNNCKKELWLFT
jgi:hypothetical protein